MRLRAVPLALAIAMGVAMAGPIAAGPTGPVVAPWVTTSCWIERRWFETLRNGSVDYCKRSLRYRPGKIDCVMFSDEVCWALNQQTGDYQQFRTPGLENLIQCPPGPEPPTCPRLR